MQNLPATNLTTISPALLQKRINAYFDRCDKKKTSYSLTGLALHLGVTRPALTNHSKRDDLGPILEQAKLRCENLLEERMIAGVPPTGMIFILKNNYGWTDKLEIDQTINGTISLSSLFDRAKALQAAEEVAPIDGEIIEEKEFELFE